LLFFGIILGRIYEKFLMVKKSITKRFRWAKELKR
jgi:hypothetical protein